jgi:hypothetical protein
MAPDVARVVDLPPVIGGRYRIGRPLGQGSIAQVVEAIDVAQGTTVALKILYASLRAHHVVADRFRREVQVVRRIAHRNVIAIHDLIDEGDLLCLVMELHAGGDLADRLARRGALAPAALRLLGRQLGGALDAAHRAGVVHRDVKPQNVLVGPDPERLDTRLCDFGLARTADLAGLTTRSTVLGTPEYMAPEVIADGYSDPRSDIYSLGVVLFEAATGRLPFRASSPFQMLHRHLTETPPPVRSVRADLPAAIGDAIDRALAKEPLDRFASAGELAAAFAEPGQITALAARPPAPAARATCRRCGGSVLRLAQTCVDCGARSLRLRKVEAGRAVLVTGPGAIADKLDGVSHVALVKLLDELSPGTATFTRLRKRPPRLPFYVVENVDDASAQELVARLNEVGLEARVERRASVWVKEVRRKVRAMSPRYILVWGMMSNPIIQLVRSVGLPAAGAILGAALLSAVAVPLITYRRPLVALGEGSSDDTPIVRLARWLPRIVRREDRRLLARVIERLQLATDLGSADAAALLGERAALICQGLVALADGNRHLDEAELRRAVAAGRAGDDVAAALDRLREAERVRGVLIADLLRIFGRVDQLCVRLARIGGLAAGEHAAALAREVDDLKIELDAEADVAALLA